MITIEIIFHTKNQENNNLKEKRQFIGANSKMLELSDKQLS